jgi:predicted dehydrogenase
VRKIRVVVIGYGYWGPNLVRNILLNSDYELVGVVDTDSERSRLASDTHGIFTYESVSEIEDIAKIDLAVIATRPASHMKLVELFASNGVNCLVTKPSGSSRDEALAMQNFAESYGIKVFCDFTYHFSPYIKFLLEDPKAVAIIQEMREYVSYRTALGIIQSDVDVIGDLAVHDIYVLKLLKGSIPKQVSALPLGTESRKQIHSAFISLRWEDGFSAAVHVSWKAPKKTRQISIISDSAGIILEELNSPAPLQLVRILPKFSNLNQLDPAVLKSRNESYALGNAELPMIPPSEALANEFAQLATALWSNSVDFPTIKDAVDIWSVVEAIRNSMLSGGSYIDVC